MGAINNLYKSIENGRFGKNIGISTGLPKLDSIIYGIQKKSLYTIGADSGSGKTALAIYSFVYNLIKNAKTPVNVLYYSFELSSDILYAKLLSLYIYDEYKKIVTYEDILSLTKIISEENLELINNSKPWLEKVSKIFTIYDKQLTPQAIYGTCKEWLRKFGEFKLIDEHREDYIENNVDEYKVVIIDHVGLIAGDSTKKSKIDLVCSYFIYFRNKCNITGIFVQQTNRNSKSVDRKVNGYELLQTDDLSDTSDTTQASEVVIMIYFPHREKISRCEGYPIQNILKQRGRIIQICKNRFGRSDVNIGATFFGEIGKFVNLPKPDEIGDYAPYLDLDYKEKTDGLDTNLFKM